MCIKRRLFYLKKSRRIFPKNAGRGGLWVWKPPAEVLPEKLLSQARSLGARTLFLNVYPLIDKTLDWIKNVIVAAEEQGLHIELLCGSPGMVNESTRSFVRNSIIKPLQRLQVQLQNRGIKYPLLVHLDVEPHSLGPMDEKRMTAYLNFLKWIQNNLRTAKVSVDVPVWYSALCLNGQPFKEILLGLVDTVTLMAYGRSLKSIVRESLPWLEAASRLDKKITVAIEIGNQGLVRLNTRRQVSSSIKTIVRKLKKQPGYSALQGIAVHHLDLVPDRLA